MNCKTKILEKYPFVQASFPGANNHSGGHIKNVLKYIDSIFTEDKSLIKKLKDYELFYLLMATIFHDVGNVARREGHARLSGKYVRQNLKGFFAELDDNEVNLIADIIQCHSNEEQIESIFAEEEFDVSLSKNVRAPLLSAILRFADELDETEERSPWDMYIALLDNNKIKEESKIYWNFNHIVKLIKPNIKEKIIKVRIEASFSELRSEFRHGLFNRPLVGFTLDKLAKINDQRKYCNIYFRKFGFYFDKLDCTIKEMGTNKSYHIVFDDLGFDSDFLLTNSELIVEPATSNGSRTVNQLIDDFVKLSMELFKSSLSSIILFGSYARGLKAKERKIKFDDIDFAVILKGGNRSVYSSKLTRIADILSKKHDIKFSIEPFLLSEFLNAWSFGDPLVTSICFDGVSCVDSGEFLSFELLTRNSEMKFHKKRFIEIYTTAFSEEIKKAQQFLSQGKHQDFIILAYSGISKYIQLKHIARTKKQFFDLNKSYTLSRKDKLLEFSKGTFVDSSVSKLYTKVTKLNNMIAINKPFPKNDKDLPKIIELFNKFFDSYIKGDKNGL